MRPIATSVVLGLSLALNLFLLVRSLPDPAAERAGSLSSGGIPLTPTGGRDGISKGGSPGQADLELIRNAVRDRKEADAAFAAWAATQPEEALRWVENQVEGRIRLDLFEIGIKEWAGADPAAAANWILGMSNDFTYEAAVVDLGRIWASGDGSKAAAWLATIPEAPLRRAVAEAVAETWAAGDPVSATAWALEFQKSHPDCLCFPKALAAWAAQDPSAARRYFDSLPADETASASIPLLASAAAEVDPVGTIEWALGLKDETSKWSGLSCALDAWAQVHPSKAAGFVLGSLSEEDRMEHVETVLRHWSASDNASAEDWVNQLTDGPVRQKAIGAMALNLMDCAPPRALDWALRLEGGEKTAACRQILDTWVTEDRQGAMAWLSKNQDRIPTDLATQLESNRSEE